MRAIIIVISGILMLPVWGYAQLSNIVAGEYFFDTDPGVGAATPLPAFAPNQNLDVTFLAGSSGLSKGMHMLGIRVRDDNNLWSIPTFLPVYVLASNPLAVDDISGAEYFFDTDPGIGNATVVSVGAPAPTIDLTFAAVSSALTVGLHMLAVRTRNVNGEWGIAAFTPVYVDRNRTISKLEYFFNTDPGVGNATQLPVTPATDLLDQLFTLNSSALGPATHTLNVRVAGQNDFWGIAETVSFVICSAATASISADTVCVGAATTFTDNSTNVLSGDVFSWDFQNDAVTDATTAGIQTFTYPAAGTYTATLTIDRAGCSSTDTVTLRVNDLPAVNAGTDQNLCLSSGTLAANTPNSGETGSWIIFSGTGTITDTANPVSTFTNITASTTLEWTITNSLTGCTAADQVVINGFNPPVAAFITNTVCAGNTTTFTDNSTNTQVGDIYQWDFNNDGTTDATTVGDETFTYPSAGTYTATLTIDRSGCADMASASVQVEPFPLANAGADQTICVDNTSLSANTPGTGETGAWTVFSGSGTISNAADPVSAVTGITTYSNTYAWTLTNTIGGCSNTDQVVILSNQAITTTEVSTSVSLGQTVNTDVQSPATKNPGDVLTTTIATSPKKGSASILTNGSINYSPNSGTVGKDTVIFQLCNQCSKCSMNNLIIDIINDAPVIIQDPITVSTGENVNINLLDIISDPNNNLDLTTLTITQQPLSGAIATIDASFNLNIDYTGIVFSGTDQLTIQACDLEDVCSSNIISIDVQLLEDPPITVYNALSPNGDDKHDFLEVENITAYPNNQLYIFNRWGDKVFEAKGYDNSQIRFAGKGNTGGAKDLPAGTYFYSINLGNGSSRINGFLVLKR